MTIPALHTLVANFELPAHEGYPIALWDYKHEQPVVLLFCDANDEALLQSFARRYPDYRGEGAEVLVISRHRPQKKEWPFPILLDSDGRVTARLVERTPSILVLDSYNELHARLEGPWRDGPDHRAILAGIAEQELKCPECGVPEWPNP